MPKLNAALRIRDLKAAAAPLSEDDFQAHAKTANEYLTDASRVAETMVARTSGELKVKAEKLEKMIDVARRYAFTIR